MTFQELYERHVRDVHRFALFLSGNSAVAEDLTAEAFARALSGPQELRLHSVKAYLFAITRNLYRDWLRRDRRLVSIAPPPPERVDPAPRPDVAAEDREALAVVLSAIERLPDGEREALLLAVERDLGYDEIALILGCSVAAVKVRVHRARVRLRGLLERKEPQPCR
jgi:RNA polymerase sigma-70 factor (ECF subfamily)